MPTITGFRSLAVPDPIQQTSIPLALLYPAVGTEQLERFGPYSLPLARNAKPFGERLPIVVLSHGNGGSPWTYRNLASHLAQSGFLVALPEHPGNSRNDNTLAGTMANLVNRPRHISLAIDALLADSVLASHLGPPQVAVIGHSIGAYTALALAGGEPWAAPHETPDGRPHPVPVTPDDRVRSLVLLAPATFWYPAGSLAKVDVPILIRTGGSDKITPASHGEMLQNSVANPTKVEHQTIPGAGHFFPITAFPPEMTRPDFPPSQDPPGFHREDIQPTLYADLVEFLKRTL